MSKGVRKTRDEWVALFREKHGDKFEYRDIFRDKSRTLVTFFCKKHKEEYTQRVEGVLNREFCCKSCAEEGRKHSNSMNAEEFIYKAKKIHGDLYDYTLIPNQTTSKKRINIICRKHGVFNQTVKNHLIGNQCPKCFHRKRSNLKLSKGSELIKAAKRVHGEKYTYIDFPEKMFMKDKYKIKCNECKREFKQNMNSHITNKRGCPECAKRRSSISRGGFIKLCGDSKAIFYVLHCFNDKEDFFKVGITKRSVRERYYKKGRMPYSYNVVLTVLDDPGNVYDLENKYKKGLKKHIYKPNIHFDGAVTECFTKLTI